MTSTRYILRSLLHYWRTNLGVLCGVGMGAAILIGALGVGDSMEFSLERMAMARIGRVDYAAHTGNRPFSGFLAGRLAVETGMRVAPVLTLSGTVSQSDRQARINNVNVLGVDSRFWKFAQSGRGVELSGIQVALNQKAAARLEAGIGDWLVLRAARIRRIPGENPFSEKSGSMASARVQVAAILSGAQLGRFGLYPHQAAPYNVYMDLGALNTVIKTEDQANLLLAGDEAESAISLGRAQEGLRNAWTLEDAGLHIKTNRNGRFAYLVSDSVFMRQPVVDAAMDVFSGAEGVFTYFVNSISAGGGAVPYSFASAPGDSLLPEGMKDSEVILNDWLADDLDVGPGGEVRVSYYLLAPSGALNEAERAFTVRDVVPVDRELAASVPPAEFPGLTEVESCTDWNPAAPIDIDRIRDKDEQYWNRHGATPKLYVTAQAAVDMWANRFGAMTAVRIPFAESSLKEMQGRLAAAIDPVELGLVFRPLREDAVRAGSQGVDFGQLFIGLSFFLILAALLLAGLISAFGADQRAEQIGVLSAMGFRPSCILRLLLAEHSIVLLLGIFSGSAAGVLYTRLMVKGLTSLWRDAVRTSLLYVHVDPSSIILGIVVTGTVSMAVLWLAVRRAAGRNKSVLLRERLAESPDCGSRARIAWRTVVVALCGVGVLVSVLIPAETSAGMTAAFFTAGALMLVGFWFLCDIGLLSVAGGRLLRSTSTFAVALRNASLRRWRSLLVIAVFSCGVFLIVAVAANRKASRSETDVRNSGTGGFILLGRSSIPVQADITTPEGQRSLGLNPEKLDGVSFVPFRVNEGGSANCLNLNRVSRPQLLGVNSEELARSDAFVFADRIEGMGALSGWRLLETEPGEGGVPGIADQTVIIWGLGKQLGDRVVYRDYDGNDFGVKLVAGLADSVFQGNIIVEESMLLERFPSISGYRMFLVDADAGRADDLRAYLNSQLSDWGCDFVRTDQLLAEFNSVQNTYLDIFLTLGGLGLLLGSVGLGIVVLRNVMERRGELAVLRATGFTRAMVRRLLLYEHAVLLLCGLVSGAASALVAAAPALTVPGTQAPYGSIGFMLAAVLVCGLMWVAFSTYGATRGSLISALRRE